MKTNSLTLFYLKIMKNYSVYLFALVIAFALTSCGGEGFIKYPVDEILSKTSNDKLPMSIVLYDMDVKGSRRLNKFKITTNQDDPSKKKETITQWLRVSKADFGRNYENMGMEIASKTMDSVTGKPKISKTPAPPGYSNYVGNQKYGSWQRRSDGTSFWAFYGQYMFMRSMFNLATYPVYRSSYSNYRRNYYGRRAYYGGTGTRRRYGTGSRYSRSTSRSGYYSSRRSSRSSSSYRSSRSSRSSRSGSRSGYSSRSRSGSSGK
ncbi:hypothetical protein BKI52_26785 [marine bacterium AO1-C]|nr:hypothetical protein BKI52_26785 [marine bacterium AO1-C]